MQKDGKRKKTIGKLRMILDDNSGEKLHPEDEKYLKALRKRLGGSSLEHITHIKETFKEDDGEEDPLKPRVIIHQKEEKKTVDFPEVKSVEVKKSEEEKKEKQESLPQDESLYEVEKVEVEGPEFIEVKAKEKDDVKESGETEEKIPEWEPINAEEIETEESKEEIFEDALPLPLEEKEEEASELEPMPVIKEEKEEMFIEEQTETADEFHEEETEEFQLEEELASKEKYEEEATEEKEDDKIGVFSDIASIDKNTAILLYDNGFTSINDVMEAPLKDLIRIKGIKRKAAKNIKKEIEEKFKNVSLGHDDSKKMDEFGESFIPIDEEVSTSEPVKEDELFFEDEKEEDADEFIKKDEEIDVFDGINSVDEKTAKLLYENGITSIDILSETPIKKLTKIKGIRRKIAKKIKKEVGEMPKKTEDIEDWNAADADLATDEFEESEEEWKSFAKGETTEEQEGYRHGDYTLYVKDVETKSGKKRTVHFFSKGEPEEGEPAKLPKGYEVKVNKRTRVPYIKKKK